MDFASARKHMVDSQVRPNDVTNIDLQIAMETLPREDFVPANRKAMAYAEKEVELFEGRNLLKARDYSKLVHEANIQPTDLVLDVGCGFGYTAAVVSHIAQMVVAIEEDETVVAEAEKNIAAQNIDNAVVLAGPLAEGVPKQGPFDVIIINGAIEEVPSTLLAQLKDGGRLAAIVMQDGVGKATIFKRSGDAFGGRIAFEAQPLIIFPSFKKSEGFVF